MNKTMPLALVLSGALLAALTGCGDSPATSTKKSIPSVPPASASVARTTTTSPTGGGFCGQLQALIEWQTANADQLDATDILKETARRYSDLEQVAPNEYRATMAYFAQYAAEPPAQAAQEPGFADHAEKVTEALNACGINSASR